MAVPLYHAVETPSRVRSRTSLSQIGAATWASVVGTAISIGFVVAVCLTTTGKETVSNVWVANASVLVAVGGIVLKGSLGTLIGVALYHGLWLDLARTGDWLDARKKAGLSVKEIESYHLASRLSVGMAFHPSFSIVWIAGLLGLILTSAIVPVLQYGMDVVASPIVTPTTIQLDHAQLDARMATRDGAAGSPEDATPNILRAAIVALFGGDTAFVYTKRNVTGKATFTDVQFVDVDCSTTVSPGQVDGDGKDPDERYYSFKHDFITSTGATYAYNYYQGLSFTARLNNGTDYLDHSCQVRPAVGACSIRLYQGTALMNDLLCERSAWLTPEQLPNTSDSPSIGFYAVATSFITLFEGEAWLSSQLRPQRNSTFVAATAHYFDRDSIGMPPDLLSHVKRTLWNTPINARPISLPSGEVGGAYDLNRTVDMIVQHETQILVVQVDIIVIAAVLGVAILIAIVSLLYLLLATNIVPGRLMRDSLVHTLAVGSRSHDGGAVSSAIQHPDRSDTSLEDTIRHAGDLRLRCTLVANDQFDSLPPRLVVEPVHQQRPTVVEATPPVFQVQRKQIEPRVYGEPPSHQSFPPSHQSYQSYQRSTSTEHLT